VTARPSAELLEQGSERGDVNRLGNVSHHSGSVPGGLLIAISRDEYDGEVAGIWSSLETLEEFSASHRPHPHVEQYEARARHPGEHLERIDTIPRHENAAAAAFDEIHERLAKLGVILHDQHGLSPRFAQDTILLTRIGGRG
jgi:hypothetical protein